MKNNIYKIFLSSILLVVFFSCKKLTQVGEPVNTITTTETFSTDATATSAIIGIYNDLLNGNGGNFGYANGATTADLGMSADELHIFNGPSPFETNTLNASDLDYSANFWNFPYFDIYLANAAIETLPNSPGVTLSLKQQLLGEAKFFRAFAHFYLVNLYGDVPYLKTTSYLANDTVRRTPLSQVYNNIIADLKDANNLLPDDYSASGGQRVRANKFASISLLARTYLYIGDWIDAENEASTVIANTNLYNLVGNLDSVFLANSPEAILQLQTPNATPYATNEGHTFIPFDSTTNPNYYLSQQLLSAFEPGDNRRSLWVDSSDFQGTYYYYPYKYKVYVGTQDNVTEYYMVLRLAEQYLIRAEARAQQGNITGAIQDLNIIRERAQLPDLLNTLTGPQVLAAVAQERRIELFAEWGHRWLDLKRTGQATAVLGPLKPTWKPTAVLYPVPAGELLDDANLIQNLGYQ